MESLHRLASWSAALSLCVLSCVSAEPAQTSRDDSIAHQEVLPAVGDNEPAPSRDTALTYSAIASTGDDYLVAWSDGGRVLVALVDARGVAQTPTSIVVAPDPDDAQRNSRDVAARVAVASNGHGYLVAWELVAYGSVNTHPIRFTAVSADGIVRDLGGRLFERAARDNAFAPAVASNGTDYLIAWQHPSGRVEAARVDAQGAPLDVDRVVVGEQYSNGAPAVASDGRDYLVAWTHSDGVAGAFIRASGMVSSGFSIPRAHDGFEAAAWGTPAVSFGSGDYLVAWSDGVRSVDLLGARVARDGRVRDPAGFAIARGAGAQFAPKIAFDGRDFVAVWSDARPGARCVACDPSGSPCEGCLRVRDDAFEASAIAGAKVDASGRVRERFEVADAARGQFAATVTSNGARGAVAAWGGPGGLYARSLLRGPRWPGPHARLVAPSYVRAEAPAVASDGNAFLVVWRDLRGADWDLYGARLDRDGNALDRAALAISTAPGDQGAPAVSFDGTNYLVAWHDHRGASWDIYGTRVGRNGEVRDPRGAPLSTATGDQFNPAAAGSLVAWSDLRDCDPCAAGACDPYACSVSERGGHIDASDAPRVFATRVGGDGRALDPAGIAVSAAGERALDPAVAYARATWFVVWSAPSSLVGARIDGAGRVRDAAGVAFGEPGAALPSVSTSGEAFFVAWGAERRDCAWGRCYQIEAMRFGVDGRALDAAPAVLASPATEPGGVLRRSLRAPAAAFDGARYVVAWEDRTFISFDGFPGRDLAGVGTDGVGAPTPFAIETTLWEASEAPSLASDGRGQTLVVYDRAEGLASNRTTVRARLVGARDGRRTGGRDMRWRP